MRQLTRIILTWLCFSSTSEVFALECPPFPQQASKDWEVEVKAAVVKIGPVKGGELTTRTQNATKDLMGKLPDGGRLYLEQMMYAGYCTALRDDKGMSESDKAKQLQNYAREVRRAISENNKKTQSDKSSAEIKLVDLSIDATQRAPKLDIKVRNNSAEVVIVKRAEIEVIGQWDIPAPGNPSALPSSATYDVTLSPQMKGAVAYNISQEIRPNTGDRFEIALGSTHAPYPYRGLFAYLLKVKLIYNEDNRSLVLPPVLVHIQTAMDIEGYFNPGPSRELVQRNRATAQELLKAMPKGTVAQDRILQAVKSWADADPNAVKD